MMETVACGRFLAMWVEFWGPNAKVAHRNVYMPDEAGWPCRGSRRYNYYTAQ